MGYQASPAHTPLAPTLSSRPLFTRAPRCVPDALRLQIYRLTDTLAETTAAIGETRHSATSTLDFCRRAEACFQPDGGVDESAYQALVAEYRAQGGHWPPPG
ncbi:MAG TPA: hypothetical protein VED40_21210 [Azospirillaceae bacterium]|nr:hypothetical protein [Azospirillaceae bacterium]